MLACAGHLCRLLGGLWPLPDGRIHKPGSQSGAMDTKVGGSRIMSSKIAAGMHVLHFEAIRR